MTLLIPFRRKHREDAELNLIPLIDIMSVLVAFLLVYSAEVEVVQNSKGVEVPLSSAETVGAGNDQQGQSVRTGRARGEHR
jgi:biopolymer transport protein ExbD